jgi:hypothetical protein
MCVGLGTSSGITKRIFVGEIMTELIERIAFGTVKSDDWKCPFDHDGPQKRDDSIDNDLIGIGSTLAANMKSGKSTVRQPGSSGTDKTPYPEKGEYPIEIGEWCYAVVCAAHHLIPAQASLREVPGLLDYVVSKHVSQPLKKKAPHTGKLWSDIGYDVNGTQNGVWLPGNYGVSGSDGFWTSAPSALDDDEEAVEAERRRSARSAKRNPSAVTLHGVRHDLDDPVNKKTQYVLGATRLFSAQFHDSHGPYSEKVQKALIRLGEAYYYAEERFIVEAACDKCRERMQGREDEGLPPPFGLARRLNGVSRRLKGYVKGRQGHPEIYTSRWGLAIGRRE